MRRADDDSRPSFDGFSSAPFDAFTHATNHNVAPAHVTNFASAHATNPSSMYATSPASHPFIVTPAGSPSFHSAPVKDVVQASTSAPSSSTYVFAGNAPAENGRGLVSDSRNVGRVFPYRPATDDASGARGSGWAGTYPTGYGAGYGDGYPGYPGGGYPLNYPSYYPGCYQDTSSCGYPPYTYPHSCQSFVAPQGETNASFDSYLQPTDRIRLREGGGGGGGGSNSGQRPLDDLIDVKAYGRPAVDSRDCEDSWWEPKEEGRKKRKRRRRQREIVDNDNNNNKRYAESDADDEEENDDDDGGLAQMLRQFNVGGDDGRVASYWRRMKSIYAKEAEKKRDAERRNLRSCGTTHCMLHLRPSESFWNKPDIVDGAATSGGASGDAEAWYLGFDNRKSITEEMWRRGLEQRAPAWGWGTQCGKQNF